MEFYKGKLEKLNFEFGRVGYLVLWLMGAPITLLLVLWVIFGNNIVGPG